MQIRTNTITSQNISSYLLIDTYTSDGSKEILIRVLLDNIVGNGSYSIYATIQRGGTGTFYKYSEASVVVLSGTTSLVFPSFTIPISTGDVTNIYVKGLPSDTTTVDITTDWFAFGYSVAGDAMALTSTERTTTAGVIWAETNRTLTSFGTLVSDIWANGTRTLTSFGTLVSDVWSNSTRTLTDFGTLVSDVWANGTRSLTSFGTLVSDIWSNSTRTLSGFGTLVSDIWSNATRTLTAFDFDVKVDDEDVAQAVWNYIKRTLSPFSQGDITSETNITCFRGDTFTYAFEGLDFSGYSKVYVTIKKNYQNTDAESIIQVDSATGLLILNGVVSTNPTDASITINSTSKATLVLKANTTSAIPYMTSNLLYDLEVVYSTGKVRTLQYGSFYLSRDVTRKTT